MPKLAAVLAWLLVVPAVVVAEPIGSPDLAVRGPALAPAAPREGDAVTFNATVANPGTAPAAGVYVALRVDGATIATVGPLVLLPGEAANVSNPAPWQATAGAHVFEAVADPGDDVPEAREDNNAASLAFDVGALPDLRITALTLAPSQPSAGDTVRITARVANGGAGGAGAFAVRLSLDGAVVLEEGLDGLAAGAAANVSLTWTAVEGPHTARAVADPHAAVDESEEGNNDAAQSFEVGPPPPPPVPLPDLRVVDLRTDPAGPEHGDAVTVRALVRNDGDAAAPATVARFTLDGEPLGDAATPALGPGGEAWVASPPWTAVVGTHAARAAADATHQAEESDEANNARAETVEVAPAPGLPDLVVDRLTASPASPEAGDAVVLTARVRNGGSAAAGAFDVAFHLDGEALGAVALDGLAGGAYADVRAPAWVAREGAHAAQAMADSAGEVAEADETNNARDRTLQVAAPLPNLVVQEVRPHPPSPQPGDRVTFEAVVRNDGRGAAGAFAVAFRVDGQLLGEAELPGLEPGARRSAWSAAWTAAAGAREARAEADPGQRVRESSELDNAARRALGSLARLPNLVVEQLRLEPEAPAEGEAVALVAVVANVGSASSGAADVAFERGGAQLDARALPGLAPGERAEVRSGRFVIGPGAQRFAARADASGAVAEQREDDNARTLAHEPGALAPSATSLALGPLSLVPAAPRAGEPATARVEVRNDGPHAAQAVEVRLLVDGLEVARAALGSLAAGSAATATLAWTAEPGAHALEAQALQAGLSVARTAPLRVEVAEPPGVPPAAWALLVLAALAAVALAARHRRARRAAR